MSAQDVLDLVGKQSLTGHHVVFYATTNTSFAVGESHECTVADMIPLSFVGAIGGEGNASASHELPEGLYFRLPSGQALMINYALAQRHGQCRRWASGDRREVRAGVR